MSGLGREQAVLATGGTGRPGAGAGSTKYSGQGISVRWCGREPHGRPGVVIPGSAGGASLA